MTEQPTTTSAPLVRKRLAAVRHVIQHRHIAAGLVMALGLFGALAVLVNTIDLFSPLHEKAAFSCFTLAAGVTVILLLRRCFRALFRSAGTVDLALAVEREKPELMDSLVCAVELESKAPEERRALEQALIEKVRAEAGSIDLLATVLPANLKWGNILLPAVLFAAIAALALQAPALQKARFHLGDLCRGHMSGLIVTPGNVECPTHSDVRVDVDVRRWEDQAHIVYEASGRETFVMNRAGPNSHFFTFYDVTGVLRYRIVTPSLSSPWYTIATYEPPKLDAGRISITSPPYTHRPVTELEDLRDCVAVAGSHVTVELQASPDLAVTVVHNDEQHTIALTPAGTRRYDFTLLEDANLKIELESPKGRKASPASFTIDAEPDLPPVVDIIKPRQDGQIKVDGALEIEARASDDFGLSRVTIDYSVSGGPRKAVALFEAPTPKPDAAAATSLRDEDFFHVFRAQDMALKEGDVVSYMLVATDNRAPDPQVARSEVYFIVVRPETSELEASGQGQQQKFDISGLIAETKRLIRMTWDILGGPEDERKSMSGQLQRDLRDLITETQRKRHDLKKAAQGDTGLLGDLMDSAAAEMVKAKTQMERSLLQESLQPQERALAALIALENELIKNEVKSKNSEGESGEQGDENKGDQQNQQQEKTAKSQEQKLEAMRELLEKLRRMSGQQGALNQTIARHTADADPRNTGASLAEKQQHIQNDAENLRNELEQLEDALRAAREVDAATREMASGGEKLREGAIRTGERHGRRAHNFLSGAVRSLEDSYRKAAANELKRLAQASQQLANKQRSAAETSRELSGQKPCDSGACANARNAQQGLGKAAETLLTQVSRAAGEMEETYPQAAQATGQAGATARQQNLDGKMTRAENALLYQRFDKARKNQIDAANILQQLAANLAKAATHLPAMSREEILDALNRLQNSAEQVRRLQQSDAENKDARMDQIRERVSQDIDHLSSALNEPTLRKIGDELAMPSGTGDSGSGTQRLLMLFDTAAKVLEQHLFASELKKRFSLSRRVSRPPEKYRRLVEEYFKDLSREK